MFAQRAQHVQNYARVNEDNEAKTRLRQARYELELAALRSQLREREQAPSRPTPPTQPPRPPACTALLCRPPPLRPRRPLLPPHSCCASASRAG
eukprot:scaffold94765_cov48-Phaeocystis_antarctica.AAC.1